MKHLIFILIILWAGISHGDADKAFPAAFKTDKFRIATIDQYENRIRKEYPNLTFEKLKADDVTYKEQPYKAFAYKTSGILADIKVEQTLTFINLHEGLWKLLYVEGEECIKGDASVSEWACQELIFPIKKAFTDLFLIENLNVDLKKLSSDWGKNVVVNEDSSKDPASNKPKLITLGDMKKIILDKGGQWNVEQAVWNGTTSNPLPEQPALLIKVQGPFGINSKYDQNFLYIIVENNLKLKEIDGKICTYNETYKKEFCENVYAPTKATPFPLVLINSEELSGSLAQEEKVEKEKVSQFYCGNILASYDSALRVYFEKSIFSAQEISGYRKALSILPVVADPQKLFVSAGTVEKLAAINKEPYPLSHLSEELHREIAKGKKGHCDALIPFIDTIEDEIASKKDDIYSLIQLLKDKKFDSQLIQSEVEQKNEFIKKMWDVTQKSIPPSIAQVNPRAALDIASGHLLRYYQTALSRASDKEELYTAALFKQDAYSRLLHPTDIVDVAQSIHGHGGKKYFGVRVSTGSLGHYIYGLHRDTSEAYNLQVGDRILAVNGKNANVPNMSAKDVDQVLAKTDNVVQFRIDRDGEVFDVEIEARDIDLMEYFYSLEVLKGSGEENILKIHLYSFEAGVSESIYKNVKKIMSTKDIKGFILDLQSNPGGSSEEAAAMVSLFTKNKVPFYYRKGSRFLKTAKVYPGKPELHISEKLPLIVQVNSRTASSSEIVASSLKDLNRAVVVGARTFGKFVGQHYESVPLSSKKVLAMVVTATEFFTPTGRSLNGKGLEPHINIFSQQGGVFEDGNSQGEDYVVPAEAQSELYPDFISKEKLRSISESVTIDMTDIDEVSLEVLRETQL